MTRVPERPNSGIPERKGSWGDVILVLVWVLTVAMLVARVVS